MRHLLTLGYSEVDSHSDQEVVPPKRAPESINAYYENREKQFRDDYG